MHAHPQTAVPLPAGSAARLQGLAAERQTAVAVIGQETKIIGQALRRMGVGVWRAVSTAYRVDRQLHHLSQLDDRLLRDIGLDRSTVDRHCGLRDTPRTWFC